MATSPDYASTAPSRRIKVLLIVIGLHIILGYALLSGMAKKVAAPINKPLQSTVIQEVIIPPPALSKPPPAAKLDAPKEQRHDVVEKPRQAPLEIVNPTTNAPILTAPAASISPPAPPPVANAAIPYAPPAPQTPSAPPAPATPSPAPAAKPDIHIACPKQIAPKMPRQALRDGTQGVIKAQALIRDGAVREVTIISGPSVFHAAVQRAMMQYECTFTSAAIVVTQEFNFRFD